MMKKTQMGRSMLEMLGVLSIIGIISIAALVGYTEAVRSYRVNNILDYVNRAQVEWRTQLASGAIVLSSTNESDEVILCEDLLDEDMPVGLDGCQFNVVDCDSPRAGKSANRLFFHPTTKEIFLDIITLLNRSRLSTAEGKFDSYSIDDLSITISSSGSATELVIPVSCYED